MTTAPATTRIARIEAAPGNRGPLCEAAEPRAQCAEHGTHAAAYRIERINGDTGEVWRRMLCLGAAAAWAQRYAVDFPAIAPADLMEYLEQRRDVARMPSAGGAAP